MDKKKSYSEIAKAYAMARIQNEKYLDELLTDMMLNELLLSTRKEQLLEKIDRALDQKDQAAFNRLTNELIDINKKFG